MSTVSSVSGHDTNTRFTKNGNSYQKSNLGKKIGTAAGLMYSAGRLVYRKDAVKGIFNSIKDRAAQTGSTKGVGAYFFALVAIGVGLTALIGRGIGAIGDAIADKVKANKADKAAKAE